MSGIVLPPFLAGNPWPPGTEPLARLRLTEGGTRWFLSGDAQVTMVAKRLFPGARSHGPGTASFPNTPRTMQDLVWFRQRYPIAAEPGHEAGLSDACEGARRHAETRIAAAARRGAAPGVRFRGTPRPYQNESLAFMLANMKVLIADDMGLGKTVQAIMLLASGAGFPAVVVVQPHLVPQWIDMLAAFLDCGPQGVRIATIRSRGRSRDDIRRGLDRVPDADVIVTHYGLIAYWRERLLDAGIRTLILDEVGELRHRDTDKYNACSLLSSTATHVAGLSGTPIYNYGDEIWSVMNAIDFQSMGPRDDFIREWCTGMGSRLVVSDPQALGAYLRREGLMIRRRKADVLDQLPPKHRDVVHIDSDENEFRHQMRQAVPMLRQFSGADRFARFTLAGRIGEHARRATGLAKADGALAFLATLLEAGEPVVAFAYHHDVVDALMEGLAPWRPRAYTGRETGRQKEEAKADFIEGRSDVIIINLRSATGMDGLQKRARVAVFCELDWSPAIHTQAEDRLWRDGQDSSVLIYYLVSSTGSDPDMQSKLGLKIGQAKGILDDPLESEADRAADQEATKGFVAGMIERLEKEFAHHH